MSKLIKFALYLVATVAILIVIAVVVLPLVIDPNDYKSQISAAVKQHTGRDIVIDGDLSLSVFPWLGLETGKISLSNAPGFGDQPFADIEATQIKVKLIPLLSKKVEISRIVVKSLHLNLAKNSNGVSNWDDLTSVNRPESKIQKEEKRTETAQEESGPVAFAVGGVSVEDANIVWDDEQKGQHVEISDFNFFMEQLSFDRPVDFELQLTVDNQDPKLTEKLNLSGNFTINADMDIFQLSGVKLISETVGDTIPSGVLDTEIMLSADVNLKNQTANVTGFKLNLENLIVTADLKGENIVDTPEFSGTVNIAEFSPRKLMKSFAIEVPETSDNSVLQNLKANFQLQASDKHLALNNILIQLDDTSVTGNTKIVDFATPAIAFNFEIDQIDVDRYLPPKQKDDSGRAPETPAAVPPSTAAAGAAAQLPLEALQALNIQGKVKISQLKISGIKAQGVELNLNGKNGMIQSRQSINNLYQGSYTGNMRIDARGSAPKISIKESVSEVQIGPLLVDATGKSPISGTAEFSADLNGRGADVDAIKASLNGTINAVFTDGEIKGISIIKLISSAKSLLKRLTTQNTNENDTTEFSELNFASIVTNGVVNNHQLVLKSPLIRVNGSGKVNLISENVDYKIKAKLVSTLEGQGGAEIKDLKGVPIAINITGPASNLSYSLNLVEMLKEEQNAEIEEKTQELMEKLDEKLGPGASDLLKSLF